jgi:hypothetical protein
VPIALKMHFVQLNPELGMQRKEAASFKNELLAICPLFCTTRSVSIFKEKDEWAVSILLVPHVISLDFLEKVTLKHCFETSISNERIVFRSIPKSH